MFNYFLNRPIALVILFLILGSLFVPVIMSRVKRKMNSDLKVEADDKSYESADVD